MGSFFTFTDVAQRQRDDDAGKPWPHLDLKVRKREGEGWNLHGPHVYEMGEIHDTASNAVTVVRAYCSVNRCTARIKVYKPDGNFFKEIVVERDHR